MARGEKCVEYYFDSKKYDKFEVLENMKKEQLEFERKKAKISVYLNDYGIYVATLKFINNEISIINSKIIPIIEDKMKIKIKRKTRIRKTYKGY